MYVKYATDITRAQTTQSSFGVDCYVLNPWLMANALVYNAMQNELDSRLGLHGGTGKQFKLVVLQWCRDKLRWETRLAVSLGFKYTL